MNINGTNTYFVTDVAITLTVQTQLIDPVTKQFQTETKALLNVSPRNVFNAWQLAGLGIYERVQPIPPSVTNAAAVGQRHEPKTRTKVSLSSSRCS